MASAITAQPFIGSQVMPDVSVNDGSVLTINKDYSIRFGANVLVGSNAGLVVVKGYTYSLRSC